MIHFLRLNFHSARLAWPTTILVMLLQRTPVLRMLVNAEAGTGGGAGQMLRALIPTAIALGATHTLTGQTHWTSNPTPPISGQVGTDLSVVFALTGGTATPESYSIVGTLPPGMTVPKATGTAGDLTLNSTSGGSITGTPTTAGTFSVSLTAFDAPNRGSGQFGSSTKFTIDFDIAAATTAAPAFTTQPTSQSVDAGGSVTFTVAVSGSPAPTLQWRKGSVALAGKTGTSLTINPVTTADAGSYDCVATNASGNATSNAATLTVTGQPTIETQPIAIKSVQGAGAFFAVQASGTNNAYQWRKGGVDLDGETHSSLFIASVDAGDAGSYSVHVSNPAGTVDSNAAPLTVASTGHARLVNLSARAMIGTGGDVLIPGFADRRWHRQDRAHSHDRSEAGRLQRAGIPRESVDAAVPRRHAE